MREILFKAKRTDNGEWAEGFYSQLPKPSLGATIITNGDLCAEDVSDYIIVNQCKQHSNFSNGYPLEVVECEYYEIDPETLCQYTGSRDNNSVRIWENDIVLCKSGETKFSFNEIMLVDDIINYQTMSILTECEYLEVLGNRFDNPELLSQCINFLDHERNEEK